MWFRVLTVLGKKNEGFEFRYPFPSRCDREFDSLDELIAALAAFFGIAEIYDVDEDTEPGLKGFTWLIVSYRSNTEMREVRVLVKECE